MKFSTSVSHNFIRSTRATTRQFMGVSFEISPPTRRRRVHLLVVDIFDSATCSVLANHISRNEKSLSGRLQQGLAALARGPFLAPEAPENDPRAHDQGTGNTPGNRVKPESKTRNFINNLWSQQRFLIPYKNMTER